MRIGLRDAGGDGTCARYPAFCAILSLGLGGWSAESSHTRQWKATPTLSPPDPTENCTTGRPRGQ